MNKKNKHNTYLSPLTTKILAASMLLQLPVLLAWTATHYANVSIFNVVLLGACSIILLTHGLFIVRKDKREAQTSLAFVFEGVVSLIIALAGFFYVFAPVIVYVPLFGALSILFANIVLSLLVSSALLIAPVLAAVFAAFELIKAMKNPRK